jgi:hypothetical protein
MAPDLLDLFQRQVEVSEIVYKASDIWALGAMAFFILTTDKGFKAWRRLSHAVGNCEPWPRGEAISNAGLEFILRTTAHIAAERLFIDSSWLADIMPTKLMIPIPDDE